MSDISPDDEVDDFADWPDTDLDIDDEAFAAAIARGREDDEAA